MRPANQPLICVMSSFCRKVDTICAELRNYAEYSRNSSQTFRDNLSVPSSGGQKMIFGGFLTPEVGADRLTWYVDLKNYNYTLRNVPEEHRCWPTLTAVANWPRKRGWTPLMQWYLAGTNVCGQVSFQKLLNSYIKFSFAKSAFKIGRLNTVGTLRT